MLRDGPSFLSKGMDIPGSEGGGLGRRVPPRGHASLVHGTSFFRSFHLLGFLASGVASASDALFLSFPPRHPVIEMLSSFEAQMQSGCPERWVLGALGGAAGREASCSCLSKGPTPHPVSLLYPANTAILENLRSHRCPAQSHPAPHSSLPARNVPDAAGCKHTPTSWARPSPRPLPIRAPLGLE